MKKIKLLLLLLSIVLVTACKKNGEIIKYPSFGTLNINGTLASPLIVKIDGKIIDTLNLDGGFSKPVAEGSHKISLADSTNKPLIDTTLKFERAKTTYLNNFFYTGNSILFPDADTTKNPPRGSAWVRFVIIDKTLPDELNLEVSLYDFNTGVKIPAGEIKNVKKDRFSAYIELNKLTSPEIDVLYVIEGTDLSGKKVLSVDDYSCGFISFSDNYDEYNFVPNSIISIGIGPPPADGSSNFHLPQLIFKRVAK